MTRPIVWSIAGADSGGGAGLAADQRAADAFGVHLCPVVAAVTAQNSREVARVAPVDDALLDAQLDALERDMPPVAVKTGLLGSAANVRAVARRVDRLRARGPVALVVDPVLGSTTGAAFAGDDVLDAYRRELLPRATVITPNRREAARLLGDVAREPGATVPALARALRAEGAACACVTGGDDSAAERLALDWLDAPHAAGWLAAARVDTLHHHGTGCTFATSVASAIALGFVDADAIVLAKMATTLALRDGYAAGAGAGPVRARAGFAADPSLLPAMSWSESAAFARGPWASGHGAPRPGAARGRSPAGGTPAAEGSVGLYAIAGDSAQLASLVAAGARTVQLRIKRPARPEPGFEELLRGEIARSIDACRAAGATLYVNDWWRVARELGAGGVHLGQEDLLAMSERERDELAASGLRLGVSTHSLWELCRARALAPAYVACGPVWPTVTKDLPWLPQGLDNVAWWHRMAGAPVVAIGGLTDASRVRAVAASGADGACVVRAADAGAAASLARAFDEGRESPRTRVPELPHPSLPNGFATPQPGRAPLEPR